MGTLIVLYILGRNGEQLAPVSGFCYVHSAYYVCLDLIVNWDLNPVAKLPQPGHNKIAANSFAVCAANELAACHHWLSLQMQTHFPRKGGNVSAFAGYHWLH